jgi:hypothetical protein
MAGKENVMSALSIGPVLAGPWSRMMTALVQDTDRWWTYTELGDVGNGADCHFTTPRQLVLNAARAGFLESKGPKGKRKYRLRMDRSAEKLTGGG